MDFIHDYEIHEYVEYVSDASSEAQYGAFDGEERDLELINAYGIDIDELEEDLGHQLNIDRRSESSGGSNFGENEQLEQHNNVYYEEQGIRFPGTSRYQYHSKSSVEIFAEIKEAVLAESPTLRLSVAVESGDVEQVQAEFDNGAKLFVGTPQNILRRRIMRLSTGQMYSYENIEEKNEKTVDQRDKICLLLMNKCPELIDFECLILMINQEMLALLNFTLDHLEQHNLYQTCFQRKREEVLDSLFKETFIEKAITLGSMQILPIFKRLKYNINTGFQLLSHDFGGDVTVLDKFLYNLIFKLERTGYGWVQFDEAISSIRERLIDKSQGRLQFGYSVVLANMCDYG